MPHRPEPQPHIAPLERGEKTERIEHLKLRSYSKAEIILIAAGQKPATEIDVMEGDSNFQEIADAAKALGLVVLKRDNHVLDGQQANLIIARDQQTATALSTADASNDHAKYGELMGFPASAIEAFSKKGTILSGDESNALTTGMAMNEMALSRNNFHDELAHLQRWEETVQRLAPSVHADIVEAKYGEQTVDSLDQIDLENIEDITLLFETGSDELLLEFARLVEADIEEIQLAAYFQRMKKEIRATMQAGIRDRLLQQPALDEQEQKIGKVIECIEPQARDAVRMALEKGYPVVAVGFSSPEGYQYVRLSSPLFEGISIPEHATAELEQMGIQVSVESGREINLIPQSRVSADQLQNAWNIVAAALPTVE